MNEDNGKGYGCFVMFVSGVALLVALTALLKWDNPLGGFSGESYVIAALSALITFVVAWQIWQTMISRDEIKKAEMIGEKYADIERKLKESEQTVSCIHNLSLGKKEYAEGHYDDSVIYLAKALIIANDFPDLFYNDELYKAIYRFYKDNRDIWISQDAKTMMITALYLSSHSQKQELIDYFYKAKVIEISH